MLTAKLDQLRDRLAQPDSKENALAELRKERKAWFDSLHSVNDWEATNLRELFALELSEIRSLPPAQDAAITAVVKEIRALREPYTRQSPLHHQVSQEMVSARYYINYPGSPASRLIANGYTLQLKGRIQEALACYLTARSWLESVPFAPGNRELWISTENRIGNMWRDWDRLDLSLGAFQRGQALGHLDFPDTGGCLEQNLGVTLRSLGRTQEAISAYERAIELWTAGERNEERERWISAAESNLANAYGQLGDCHREMARHRRQAHLAEERFARSPTIDNRDALAGCLCNLGNALRHQGLLEDGLEQNRRARDLLLEAGPHDRDLRHRLALMELNLGNALCQVHESEESGRCLRSAILIWRELAAEGRPGTEQFIANAEHSLSILLGQMDDPERALSFQLQSVQKLLVAGLAESERHNLARAYANAGGLSHTLGRLEEAGSAYEQAISLWLECLDFYPKARIELADSRNGLGGVYLDEGRFQQAVEQHQAALEIFEALIAEHGRLDLRRKRAQTTSLLGNSYLALGQCEAAKAHLERADALWAELASSQSEQGDSKLLLQEALARLGGTSAEQRQVRDAQMTPSESEKSDGDVGGGATNSSQTVSYQDSSSSDAGECLAEDFVMDDADLARLRTARRWFRQNVPGARATRGWEEAALETPHLLAGLQPLFLAPGYEFRLVFSVSDYGDAFSQLFAVPSRWRSAPLGARLLNPEDPSSDNPDDPSEPIWVASDDADDDLDEFDAPRPPGACPHFMSAVRGDDSAYSYLLASFLSRDGERPVASRPARGWATQELLHESPFWSSDRCQAAAAELWKAALLSDEQAASFLGGWLQAEIVDGPVAQRTFSELLWDHERFVSFRDALSEYVQGMKSFLTGKRLHEGQLHGLDPFLELVGSWVITPRSKENWTWKVAVPEVWRPTVRLRPAVAIVSFVTYSAQDDELVLHRDRYERGSYVGQSEWVKLGWGGGGWMSS